MQTIELNTLNTYLSLKAVEEIRETQSDRYKYIKAKSSIFYKNNQTVKQRTKCQKKKKKVCSKIMENKLLMVKTNCHQRI